MSTPAETLASIRHAVQMAERRLKELDAKSKLTRSEVYERDMVVACITRGKSIIDGTTPPPSGGHYLMPLED